MWPALLVAEETSQRPGSRRSLSSRRRPEVVAKRSIWRRFSERSLAVDRPCPSAEAEDEGVVHGRRNNHHLGGPDAGGKRPPRRGPQVEDRAALRDSERQQCPEVDG